MVQGQWDALNSANVLVPDVDRERAIPKLLAHDTDVASGTKSRVSCRQYDNSNRRVGVYPRAHRDEFSNCTVARKTIPRLRLIHRQGHNGTFLVVYQEDTHTSPGL